MAFEIPGPPFKLSAQDMGGFDLGGAINSGFDAFNKFQQARYTPKTLAEDLLAKQLQNKIHGINAKYAEPLARAQLAHQQALTARAGRGPQIAASTLEKALAGAERIKQQYGADSPQAKVAEAYLNKISQGSGGISVGVDPDTGLPLVQIGGQGGSRGGSNKLYQTQEGEVLAQPTGSAATNLQNRVVGAETVQPYIEEIMNTLPQFQNIPKLAKTYAQGASNALLGTQYKEPSEMASGKAALKEASEGLLKTFGLNATGANRQAMEDVLAPHLGESPEGYKERVNKQLSSFMENKSYAQKSLRRGIGISDQKKRLKYNPATGRLE